MPSGRLTSTLKTHVMLGDWSVLTKEQDSILAALMAQVNQLCNASATKKMKPVSVEPKPEGSKVKEERDKKGAWTKSFLKEGDLDTKVVDGTLYHLGCKQHPKQ